MAEPAPTDALNAYLLRAAVSATAPDGPLRGMDVCVKDLVDVGGLPTRAGSARWRRDPSTDATAVARLRAAGAAVAGKGNTNEFALGIDGLNPHHGDCRHPLDGARMTGGSSSGPAAAVAGGLADLGLGTDTTGSLRVPAAFCGIVGVRPTRGSVPADGVLDLAPTYDVVGPLARDVTGAALALGVLQDDPALVAWAASRPTPPGRLDGVRLGVVDDWHQTRCDPEVLASFDRALATAAARGAQIVGVTLPELEDVEQTHMVVQLSEAAAVHAPWFAEQREHYAERVRALLERGAGYPAETVQARRAHRAGIAAAVDAALAAGLDALVMPAAPCSAPRRDATSVRLVGGEAELRPALLALAIPFSQATGPTVALPMGRGADGFPLGLQLHGRAGGEPALLALALALEAALR